MSSKDINVHRSKVFQAVSNICEYFHWCNYPTLKGIITKRISLGQFVSYK